MMKRLEYLRNIRGIGSPLASLGDRFWNREQLERHMSRTDAITISEALNVIKEEGMV